MSDQQDREILSRFEDYERYPMLCMRHGCDQKAGHDGGCDKRPEQPPAQPDPRSLVCHCGESLANHPGDHVPVNVAPDPLWVPPDIEKVKNWPTHADGSPQYRCPLCGEPNPSDEHHARHKVEPDIGALIAKHAYAVRMFWGPQGEDHIGTVDLAGDALLAAYTAQQATIAERDATIERLMDILGPCRIETGPDDDPDTRGSRWCAVHDGHDRPEDCAVAVARAALEATE